MRPIQLPAYIKDIWTHNYSNANATKAIQQQYQRLTSLKPQVSVVIPAYNESENIVRTLTSLTNNITKYSVEIIVVNNNSTDDTAALVNACGVPCILETNQGITNARNAGLSVAKGTYILNADADTIYPKHWIEQMVLPLEKSEVVLTYGNFSFIPVGSTGRFTYFFYEYFADFMRFLNIYLKDEAVNVYGFNSGFKKEQGLAVDMFNHPPGTNEDGWLAVKLRKKFNGTLYKVTASNALVWTTDRRLQIDGGLVKATIRRIKRMFFKGER